MDAISPSRESVPYSLKISRSNPVAAEDENIFTIVSGTNSPGNPMYFVNFPIASDRKSRKPDALNIPTAVIRPINVYNRKKSTFSTFDKNTVYIYLL